MWLGCGFKEDPIRPLFYKIPRQINLRHLRVMAAWEIMDIQSGRWEGDKTLARVCLKKKKGKEKKLRRPVKLQDTLVSINFQRVSWVSSRRLPQMRYTLLKLSLGLWEILGQVHVMYTSCLGSITSSSWQNASQSVMHLKERSKSLHILLQIWDGFPTCLLSNMGQTLKEKIGITH